MGDGQWSRKGGYYVPFVTGLALCCFLLCHARPGNRCGGQQMCLLGGHVVQGITDSCFLVFIFLYMYMQIHYILKMYELVNI